MRRPERSRSGGPHRRPKPPLSSEHLASPMGPQLAHSQFPYHNRLWRKWKTRSPGWQTDQGMQIAILKLALLSCWWPTRPRLEREISFWPGDTVHPRGVTQGKSQGHSVSYVGQGSPSFAVLGEGLVWMRIMESSSLEISSFLGAMGQQEN